MRNIKSDGAEMNSSASTLQEKEAPLTAVEIPGTWLSLRAY